MNDIEEALLDPVEQTIQATIETYRKENGLRKVCDSFKVSRYVNWMGTIDKRYAPPADLRIRVQCEAVIEREGKGQRIVRLESLRGKEWARVREESRKEGIEIGSRDHLVEVRHANGI